MKWQPIQNLKQAYIFWLARRLPTCEQLLPLMSQAMDRKLSLRERFVLNLHNSFCEWCLRYAKQIRLIREVMQRQSSTADVEGSAEVALSNDARERMKRMLTEQ